MKRVVVLSAVFVLLGGVALAAQREKATVKTAVKTTVKTMPPVVVNTVPQAGDISVDPATKEIQVTFSKKMVDGSWSWSTVSDDTNPETAGKPRYLEDQKTCVLPVKLKPGHVYAFWLNSQRFQGFRAQDGQAAVPYLLVFETQK